MAALARTLTRARTGGMIRLIRGFAQSSPAESLESSPSAKTPMPGSDSSAPPVGAAARLLTWMSLLKNVDYQMLKSSKVRALVLGNAGNESAASVKAVDVDDCIKVFEAGKKEDVSFHEYLWRGRLYIIRGSFDKAWVCLEKATELVTEGTIDHALCLLFSAEAFFLQKQHEKSINKLKQVLEIVKRNPEDGCQLKAESEILLADALAATGKFQDAVPLYLSAVPDKENLSEDKSHVCGDYLRLVETLMEVRRFPEAIKYCNKVIELAEKGSHTEANARRLLSLVYKSTEDPKYVEEAKLTKELYLKQGRDEEALWIDLELCVQKLDSKEYEEATKALEALLDNEKAGDRLKGFAHVNLAKVCIMKNQAEGAAANCEEASLLLRKSKIDSLRDAEAFAEMGTIFEAVRDFESALEHFKEAQRMYTGIPEATAALAETYTRIGHVYLVLEKYEDADSTLRRGLNIIEEKFGKEHPDLGEILNTMGVVNLELKNLVAALGQFERARAIAIKTFGPGDRSTLAATINMVTAYSSLNRWDKAIKCQKEVLEHFERQKAEPEVLKKARDTLDKLQVLMNKSAAMAHSAGMC